MCWARASAPAMSLRWAMIGWSSTGRRRTFRSNKGRSPSTGPVLSEESVAFRPDGQPDAGRTYKHLAELAAPVSTCKLFDTVEVWGSSPHGPTIYFNKLPTVVAIPKAPKSSVRTLCYAFAYS